MEVTAEGAKTKTLAVFENVVTKERKRTRKKFRPHRFYDEDSSPSESELVIDDEANEQVSRRKKSGVRIRFKQETLDMTCEWNHCYETFSDSEKLANHLLSHVEDIETMLEFTCQWSNCPSPENIPSEQMLIRHIMYHAYLAKLVNIGENAVSRNKLPECALEKKYTIDIPTTNYYCEWEICNNLAFNTIFDFLCHIDCHIMGAPSGKVKTKLVSIHCEWSGCNGTFTTRYKLADHLKVHTKEKSIACPKCMSLYSSRTTFSDHRKRQSLTDMRSYQCSQCFKLFSIERLLSDHMRSHINQYKCTLCDMTSPKPSMLAKHYRYRHMNFRPFECHVCKKTFVTKSNLNNHLLTHQDKPFKCDQCEFGCKSKVGLRSHLNKVHGLETTIYECQVCKKHYKRGDYLTCHVIKAHKFHWPPGHCRFRYRKDTDGIHRLQTVRYESLEVTEQMIQSESMQSKKNPSAVTYSVKYDSEAADEYKFTAFQETTKDEIDIGPVELSGGAPENPTEDSKDSKQMVDRSVIITIEDVDEKGNVIHSKELDCNEFGLFVDEEESYGDMLVDFTVSAEKIKSIAD